MVIWDGGMVLGIVISSSNIPAERLLCGWNYFWGWGGGKIRPGGPAFQRYLLIHWPSFDLLVWGGEVAALAAALLWFLTVSKLSAGLSSVALAAACFSSAAPNALDTPMANCASSRAWTAAMSACSAFPRAVAVLKCSKVQTMINWNSFQHMYN